MSVRQLPKRINNDQALYFDSTKNRYVNLHQPSKLNRQDSFTISFWLYPETLAAGDINARFIDSPNHLFIGRATQNQISFRVFTDLGTAQPIPNLQFDDTSIINNGAIFCTFVYDQDNELVRSHLNGVRQTEIATAAGAVLNAVSGDWIFFDTNDSISSAISNIIYFSKALSDDEIQTLFLNLGFPQEDLQPNVLLHLACTQKRYFKADAAFAAKYPDFSVNDQVLLDVSEQYNHTKVTGITASHGELFNFTDIELIENPFSIYNTKTKSISFPLGIKFDGLSELLYTNDQYNIGVGESFSIEWIESGDDAGANGIWSTINSGLTSGIYIRQQNSTDLSIIIDQNNADATGFLFQFPSAISSKPRHIIFICDNSQTEVIDQNGASTGNLTSTSVCRLIADGIVLVPERIHRRNGIGVSTTYFYDGTDAINAQPLNIGSAFPTGARTTNSLYSWLFYRKALSQDEYLSRFRNRFGYPLSLDADIEDALAINSLTPQSIKNSDVIASTTGMADSYLNESENGFPKSLQGLFYDGVDDQQNFGQLTTPIVEGRRELTLIVTFKLPEEVDAKDDATGVGLAEFYPDAYNVNNNQNRLFLYYRTNVTNEITLTAGAQNDLTVSGSGLSASVKNSFNQILEVAFRIRETDTVTKRGDADIFVNGVLYNTVNNMQLPDISQFGIGVGAECNIGVNRNRTHKGHIYRTALYNRFLSRKEIAASWNNSLLAPLDRRGLEFYVGSNELDYFDNGGTETVIERIKGNDGVVVGYVDLPDLVSNLESIDATR